MQRLKKEGNNYRSCLEEMNLKLKEEQKIQMEEINSIIYQFQQQLFDQFHKKKNENYNLVR